jgi:hypothetical protein
MIAAAVWIALSVITNASAGSRIAAPASAPLATGTPATAPADEIPTYQTGNAVQVKWGGLWRNAKIVQRENDIYQVQYDHTSAAANEWVTIDRIRTPGSTRDIAVVSPTPLRQKPDAAARAAALENYKRSLAGGPTPAGIPAAPSFGGGIDVGNAGRIAARSPQLTTDWQYKPDPATVAGLKPTSIALAAPTGQFFERFDKLLFSATAPIKAGVSYVDAPPGKPAQARMDLLDLPGGHRLRTITFPPNLVPMALSPDASRVVAVNKSETYPSEIEVFSIAADGKLTQVAALSPYAGEAQGPGRAVELVAMPDNDHVLVASRYGKVSAWTLADKRPLWAMEGVLSGHAIATPGGKFALIDTRDGAYMIDILAGKCVGKLAIDTTANLRSLHPDGKLLACSSYGRIRIVDLATNTVANDIALPPQTAGFPISWVNENYLLLGNRFLLDIAKGIIVWEYTSSNGFDALPSLGNLLWTVVPPTSQRGGTYTLAPLSIPHPAALAAARAVDDKAYAIKPGVKVTLVVNTGGLGDPAVVSDSLTRRLTENGMTVAPDQPLKLIAEITPGKSRDVQYHSFNTSGNQTVNVTDKNVSLRFTVNDKPIWEIATVYSAPIFIPMKQGQTVDQAIQEAQASAWKFFQSADLPKRVPAYGNTLGFGKSALNAAR